MLVSSILHDDTVTIETNTTGLPDADGVPTTTTTETEWAGVNVQQIKAELLTDDDRNTSRTWYRVSGPTPPVDMTTADTILWRGTRYIIDGEPDTRSGLGRIEHTSLRMYYARG